LHAELLFLAQISTKSFGGWGFAPNLTGGAYSAPPDPLAVFRGPTSKRSKGGEGRASIKMMPHQTKILNTPLAVRVEHTCMHLHSIMPVSMWHFRVLYNSR